jgi:hypothetical protein
MADELHRDTRRRFEQWAKNPLCEANQVSAVHGVPMVEVARAEGLKPSMGQSPFAITRGRTFEKRLFEEDARALREALQEEELLPVDAPVEFVDLRLRQVGGPCRDLDTARARTTELLRAVASGNDRYRVVASAAIVVPGAAMLPEAMLVLDALLVSPAEGGRARLTVGEVKTYPYRGGFTDRAELALARAQAGVYVHGLREVAREIGVADSLVVDTQGFLVLSRPGYNRAKVLRGEDLEFQARRAERGFEQLRAIARKLAPLPAPRRVPAVLEAPIAYDETCVSFCDRAPSCRRKALEAGDPAVLGRDVGRFLGSLDLGRAVALLGGEPAASVVEEDFLRRVQQLDGGAA